MSLATASSARRGKPLRPILKNSVFKIRSAHHKPFSNSDISGNSQGFLKTSHQSTMAQAPSVYLYLSQCAGIGYKEAENLVASGQLAFGEDCELVTDLQQLKMQLPFEAVQDLQLKIFDNVYGTKSFVPVEQRHLHRQYIATYLRRGVKFASDPSEPRSFIYTLPQDLANPITSSSSSSPSSSSPADEKNNKKEDKTQQVSSSSSSSSASSSYFNLILPAGCRDRNCYGFGIATNDLAMTPYFRHRHNGNFGIYRVWFEPGVPQEQVDEIAFNLNEMLRGEQAEHWQVVDEDCQQSVPQFAFSCDGLLFPSRINRTFEKLLRENGKLTQHLTKFKTSSSPSSSSSSSSENFSTVAKSIWLCTPYLPKSWTRELLMQGVSASGNLTSGIEVVQIGHNFRFHHPEFDEYIGGFAGAGGDHDDVEKFEIEKKSWEKLDQELSREKKKSFGSLHIFSPGRRSSNWLGHFNSSGSSSPSAMKKQWFEPLSQEAISSLHETEKRFKISNVVRSLREAVAE